MCRDGGRVVGFACLAGEGEQAALFVAPERQCEGIGAALPDLTGVRRRPFLTVLHRGLRENIFPLRSKGSLCGVF